MKEEPGDHLFEGVGGVASMKNTMGIAIGVSWEFSVGGGAGPSLDGANVIVRV